MKYLLKNSKGIGTVVFLIALLGSMHYVLESKEKEYQERLGVAIPLMIKKIKMECDINGGFKIDGVEYLCIPKDAI